jgi:hypothetical protein
VPASTCSASGSSWHEAEPRHAWVDLDHEMCVRATKLPIT